MKKDITAETLRDHVLYEPATGVFTRKIFPKWEKFPDTSKPIGSDCHGYLSFSVCGKTRLAHIMAWLYVTGSWPDREIDHKDRNRANNKWDNLRLATPAQQRQNAGKRRDNTSGYVGISKNKRKSIWIATIQVGGKRKYLGCSQDPKIAGEMYLKAKREYHPFSE
jgi:hypothetical protein